MTRKVEFILAAKDKASGVFGKFRAGLPSLKTAAIAATGAIMATAGALFAIAKTTATTHDEVRKFADQLGLATRFISEMQYAADLSGIATETFKKSIQKFTVGIGEAGKGMGQAKDAFADLGIEIENTDGSLKTAEDLLPLVADKFAGMTDATQKAEMAAKLFGQKGMEMVQMLNQGSGAINKMREEAKLFGISISEDAADKAAEFNDSLLRLKSSFKGLKDYIGVAVMPVITRFANSMAKFGADNRPAIINFLKDAGSWIMGFAERSAVAIAWVGDAFRGWKMIWAGLKVGFWSFTKVVWTGLKILRDKQIEFLKTFNYKGVFDAQIAAAKMYARQQEEILDIIPAKIKAAKIELNNLAMNVSVVDRVKNYIQTAKDKFDAFSESTETATKKAKDFKDTMASVPSALEATENELVHIKNSADAAADAMAALNQASYSLPVYTPGGGGANGTGGGGGFMYDDQGNLLDRPMSLGGTRPGPTVTFSTPAPTIAVASSGRTGGVSVTIEKVVISGVNDPEEIARQIVRPLKIELERLAYST